MMGRWDESDDARRERSKDDPAAPRAPGEPRRGEERCHGESGGGANINNESDERRTSARGARVGRMVRPSARCCRCWSRDQLERARSGTATEAVGAVVARSARCRPLLLVRRGDARRAPRHTQRDEARRGEARRTHLLVEHAAERVGDLKPGEVTVTRSGREAIGHPHTLRHATSSLDRSIVDAT